ncbi:TRAP transporter small permease [Robertmurraya yapensis]|uniref:TRAP transporter small permease n=2 Tax=Bacillaceae TaxID=186817 RepID=A0A3S0KK32_9BACI|nr:TRAP transporter small permease [Bacillus yapensis]RTR32302.1 TRAP transporter small permease [Bacillus yapensis]TKS96496.1 TRAP transporter small permease [Bacillus yapensis]
MKPEVQESQSLGAPALNDASFLQKLTTKFEAITLFLNNALHRVSSIILFLLMFLTLADVVGRYFFNKPITGTYEITSLALALMIFFSLGSAQIKKDHIEIDFLTNKMPVKVQNFLGLLSSLLLTILMALTTWQLYEYTMRVWLGHETSGDLGMPLYIFSGLTIIGAFCFTLTYLLDGLKNLLKLVKKNES